MNKNLTIGLLVGLILLGLFLYLKSKKVIKPTKKNNTVIVQKNNRGDLLVKKDIEAGTTIKADRARHKIALYSCPTGVEFGYNYEIFHIGDFSVNVGTTRYFPVLAFNAQIMKSMELSLGIGVYGIFGGVIRVE